MGWVFAGAAVAAILFALFSPQWRARSRRKREDVSDVAAEAVRRRIEGRSPTRED